MNVAVPERIAGGGRGVAWVRDGAQKLAAGKLSVLVQSGAGRPAFFPDEAYEKAGARLVPDAATAYTDGNALLKVQPPTLEEVGRMQAGAVLISFLQPAWNGEVVKALARQRVTAFSLELVPRISRAQSIDALSSQANVAGYKAVMPTAARHRKRI